MCCIDSFKKGVGKKFFESCETFLKENNFEGEVESKELDNELWLKSKNEKDSIESHIYIKEFSLKDLKNLSPSKLKSLLKRFVNSENYETAAIIRDEILKRELK